MTDQQPIINDPRTSPTGDYDELRRRLVALGQYCVAWSRWLSATDDDGKIRWSRVCRQWLGELRKTRSTRKAEQNTDDPVVRLLRQGGE